MIPLWSEVETVVSNNSVCTTGTWLVEGICSKQFSVLIAGGLVNPIQGSEMGCMPFRMLNLSSINVTMCKDAEVAVAARIEESTLAAISTFECYKQI